jgi:hypothetical protein
MKAYEALANYVVDQNCTISVFDGEEWSTKSSTDIPAILHDTEGVEEATWLIRRDGEAIANVLILPYGVDQQTESVADWSGDFVDEWYELYFEGLECEAEELRLS